MATTKTTPKEQDTYTLTAQAGLGIGIGAVPPGTAVTIENIHTKPIPGVGGSEGVLFSWPSPDSPDPRSAHLPMADFKRLFEKVGK